MDVETKEDALCVSEHDVIKATQSFHGNHDRLSDEDIQFVIEMHPVIQPYGPCDTWGMMSGVTNPYVVEHEVVQVPPVKAAPKPLVKTPFRIYDEAGAAASMCGCSGRKLTHFSEALPPELGAGGVRYTEVAWASVVRALNASIADAQCPGMAVLLWDLLIPARLVIGLALFLGLVPFALVLFAVGRADVVHSVAAPLEGFMAHNLRTVLTRAGVHAALDKLGPKVFTPNGLAVSFVPGRPVGRPTGQRPDEPEWCDSLLLEFL